MNKVIFIYVLTLLVCFSSATIPRGKEFKETADAKPAPQHETKVPEAHSGNIPEPSPDHTNDATKHSEPNPVTDTKHVEQPPVVNKDNSTKYIEPTNNATKPNATTPEIKPTVAPAPTTASEAKPTVVTEKPSTGNTTTTKPDGHNVVPDGKDIKPAVTTEKTISSTNKPTETPKPHEVVLQSRGFDGPSFFGGIILTLGMFAIGFIGFKYYKSQSERNYHTL